MGMGKVQICCILLLSIPFCLLFNPPLNIHKTLAHGANAMIDTLMFYEYGPMGISNLPSTAIQFSVQ